MTRSRVTSRRSRGTRALVALALIVSTALVAGRAGAQPLDLDAVLGRPIFSDLASAEDVPRIAWVENVRGVRNVWTAGAPRYEPRKLTDYRRDSGQPVGSLRLTRDGALLIYVRGSAPNAAGESANPASDPAGAERTMWAVPTDGSREPWQIAGGAGGPVIAPDGTRAIYAQGGSVFAVSLAPPEAKTTGEEPAGDEETKEETESAPEPELLFQVRGGVGGLEFAHDGERIAFSSGRGDHAFVGVFHPAASGNDGDVADEEGGRIVWIAPGVDRDSAPAFSPDGNRVAFVRTRGARFGERFDITGGTPFAIWVGDPERGVGREVWASPGEDGGFAQWYPSTPLAWAGDERLVFTSEHEGWLHAYTLAVGRGMPEGKVAAVDLTPGPFEIEGFTVAPGGEQVLVWGNQDDRNRRHVWRVDPAGGEMSRLTSGEGIEVEPHPLANGRIAVRFATAREPMAIGILENNRESDGKVRRVAPERWPETFPASRLVEPEAVTFQAADGLTIHGQLFLPPGATGGDKRPAAIFLHGGPVRQMLLGWHYSGYYANAYAFNQVLASRGYAVLAVNFRAGIGYGRGFRQAPGQGPRGASEYQDVVAAGRYLAARPDVDAERIGLWGGSYGGLLTAMALARDSDLFAAGVDLHGVHDWAARATGLPIPGGAWGLIDDELPTARASSPVASVDRWRSPVLFVHGDDDRNVLFQQTTDLVQRLRDRDVHVELLVFPDEVHGFYRYASWRRTFEAALDFFDRFLGAQSSSSS